MIGADEKRRDTNALTSVFRRLWWRIVARCCFALKLA